MGEEQKKRVLASIGRYFDRVESDAKFAASETEKRQHDFSKGKKKARKKARGCPPESEEHIAIADYLRLCRANFIHPNNNARSAVAGARLKRMGVVKGTGDILVLTTPPGTPGYKGCAIEVKAMDGRPSAEQIQWLGNIEQDGFLAYVVWGAEAGIRVLKELGYTPASEKDRNEKRTDTVNTKGCKKSCVLQVFSVPSGAWINAKRNR